MVDFNTFVQKSVEMSVARVRALTLLTGEGSSMESIVEMSVARVRTSQRIISEKSTKVPTEKISTFSKKSP